MVDKLKWPCVAIILGVVALVLFRKAINGLLAKSNGISIGKGLLSFAAPPQQLPETQKENDLIDARRLIEIPFNEAIRHQEGVIRDYLKKIEFKDAAEREGLIIRAWARSQVFSVFDHLSVIVFGSQLELMVTANGLADGIDERIVRTRFTSAQEADPIFHRESNFESYLGFMVNSNLLFRDGTRLKVSGFGKEFMKYLVDTGKTQPRRG